MNAAVGISVLSSLQAGYFLLPVTSLSICDSTVDLENPKNMGVSIGISLVFSIKAEILSFPV
jgi:hypothetical protein